MGRFFRPPLGLSHQQGGLVNGRSSECSRFCPLEGIYLQFCPIKYPLLQFKDLRFMIFRFQNDILFRRVMGRFFCPPFGLSRRQDDLVSGRSAECLRFCSLKGMCLQFFPFDMYPLLRFQDLRFIILKFQHNFLFQGVMGRFFRPLLGLSCYQEAVATYLQLSF